MTSVFTTSLQVSMRHFFPRTVLKRENPTPHIIFSGEFLP